MASGSFRFERFCLDTRDRQLKRDDEPVELNARYFDALALLVHEAGKLVSKERFLDGVWRGVPVTDEALTQCIKTLRRQLGDNAANPRFIETVPKHGYRFIATVEAVEPEPPAAAAASMRSTADGAPRTWREFLLLGTAGAIGGAGAGIFGGLFYGFAMASQPAGMGAVSVLLVLICLTIILGLIGGAGVAFGTAAAGYAGRGGQWSLVGGALGGLVVGAFVELLGLDAFNLLFGQSPNDITGAAEGALLGAAVGLGIWLGRPEGGGFQLRRGVAAAGLAGGAAGILIPLFGGRLMGGSLDLLARSFPSSRLRIHQLGALFGEGDFGPVSQMVTSGVEGALFCACVVGAMIVARRSLGSGDPAGAAR